MICLIFRLLLYYLYFILIRRNCFYSKADVINDPAIKKLIADQVTQWSEMTERHRREEWELMKAHVQEQKETLDKVIELVQADQLKQLEAKYER